MSRTCTRSCAPTMRRLSWRPGVRAWGTTGSFCYCLHPSVRQDLRRFWASRIQRPGGLKQQRYLFIYNQIIFRKCGKKSVELRNTGNKLYSAMKNSEALQMYTRAVQFAPHDQIYKVFSQNSPLKTPFTIFQQGKELSLALANRSAVLFKLGEFKWVSKTFVNGMKF